MMKCEINIIDVIFFILHKTFYCYCYLHHFSFYEATSATDPGVKHIYRVNADGISSCFSCTALPEEERGQYHSAEISKDGSFVSLTTSGPEPIRVDILSKVYPIY